jgi:hypothetical protein
VRAIDKNGRTTAACTASAPVRIVTIKEIDLKLFNCQRSPYLHENLVEIIGLYEYQGWISLVAEYAQVSLKHIIAIPMSLDEIRISISIICGKVQSILLFGDKS